MCVPQTHGIAESWILVVRIKDVHDMNAEFANVQYRFALKVVVSANEANSILMLHASRFHQQWSP